jgi:uncharacterized membrane protein
LTSRPERRRPYIDRVRGVAVLIMILAHVLDAWTQDADRHTAAFRNLTIVGGFAAPLFLWMAGLGLAFGGERAAGTAGSRATATLAILNRGLEIFVLAFLFRLQAFLLSPGGPLIAIFRVDILNIMGPAIVAAGLVWGVARNPRGAAVLCAAAAAAIAMTTPPVLSAAWLEWLPIWLRWHVQPAGDMTTFTLFPWSGFVFAGAATGSILSLALGERTERQMVLSIGTIGAALMALGYGASTLPTIYASSSFWTSSPTYFTIRLGAMMLALALMFAVSETSALPSAILNGLERFGRRSLFIYWIHVELVYGYLTWPIHRSLSVWTAVGSYAVFCGVMYGALHLREGAASRQSLQLRGHGLTEGALQHGSASRESGRGGLRSFV